MQRSFSDLEYAAKKVTRHDRFLGEINAVTAWSALVAEVNRSTREARDATTLLKFRRLLETHTLTARISTAINVHLADKGLLLRDGTVVDATIIAASSSI